METDHKLLVNIMIKPLHKLTARMQRMRMRFQNYNLNVKYIKGTEMYFANTLSHAQTMSTLLAYLFDKDITIAALAYAEDDLARVQAEMGKEEALQVVIKYTPQGYCYRFQVRGSQPVYAVGLHSLGCRLSGMNRRVAEGVI